MPTPVPPIAALPLARFVLRALVILNWGMAACIVVILFAMPNREWIMTALKLDPSFEADRIVLTLRAIAVLGLVIVGLNAGILKRLRAIVGTVESGDPFIGLNADRLRQIAWSLLTLQVISVVIAALARMVSTPAHPVRLDAGFSINGWLAVLLTFLLAQVFKAGTHMRDDLEGTI